MVFYLILCFATLFDFKTTSQKNKYSFATVEFVTRFIQLVNRKPIKLYFSIVNNIKSTLAIIIEIIVIFD
jgi:hypothetical protein